MNTAEINDMHLISLNTNWVYGEEVWLPRGPMCFRCLMFSLSGPCEVAILTLFYCLLGLSCGECDVIFHCILCVALLMDLMVLCVACL